MVLSLLKKIYRHTYIYLYIYIYTLGLFTKFLFIIFFLVEILWKQWQKSPENPMNQATIHYNATKSEKKEKENEIIENTLNRLRI